MKSFSTRAKSQANPTARALLELMDRKKTNLSIAADVITKRELLDMADVLGPYICVLKVLESQCYLSHFQILLIKTHYLALCRLILISLLTLTNLLF